MNGIVGAANALAMNAYWGVKNLQRKAANFVAGEARRIKEDESGMELIQVVLIILIVVVIAAALWAFLGDFISDLISQIFGKAPNPDQGDIY